MSHPSISAAGGLRAVWYTALLLGVVVLAAATSLAAAHGLTVLALVVCAIAAIPVLMTHGKFDLFSPWNYLFYFVIHNVLLRSMLIDFGINGGLIDLDATFLLGQPIDFMFWSMGLMLMGFVFLVIGYLLPAHRPQKLEYRIFSGQPFDDRRMRRLLLFGLLVSSAAFVGFVASTFEGAAEFAWYLLSSHRGLTTDLSEYRAHGYLRLLAGFSNLVAYLAYAQIRFVDSRRSKNFYRWVLIMAMMVSLAMAFYSQSRAALIFTLLNMVFIKYYLDGGKFPVRMFAVVTPVVVALFMVTSMIRGGTGVRLTDRVTPMTLVAPAVLTTGGIDASKTGHIVDYVDATQDFKFGSTLVQFITAVVPRELWQEKPVNLDTFIGEKIYGAEYYGSSAVPAGFFGEMYLNYWYAGIIVGALVLGIAIKKVANLLAGNRRSVAFILCYVVMFQSFGMSVLGSGVSSTIIGMLSAGIPLILALYYVTPRRESPPAGERAESA